MVIARSNTSAVNEDQSIGELFSQLATDTSRLVREETRLIAAEAKDSLGQGAQSAGLIAAGIVIALGGALALLTAIILVVALWLPTWAAATLVGICLLAIGLPVANRGWTALKSVELLPERSLASIKEDAEWIKERIKN